MSKSTSIFLIFTFLFISSSFSAHAQLFVGGSKAGKTLYISGKGDHIPPDSTHPETFAGQVRQSMENVRTTLTEHGMTMDNVVAAWVFMNDLDGYMEMNEVFGEFFPNGYPTRTTVEVSDLPAGSSVEITCIAYEDLKKRKQVGDQPPNRPFVPGIFAGNTLYISGKGDHLPEGKFETVHPETFEEQVRQCLDNVGEVLEMAGLDFRHVVMANVYLDNDLNNGTVNQVFREYFDFGNEPARATVFVDRIPGDSHIEITCIATKKLRDRKVVRPASLSYGPDGRAMTASPGVWAEDTLYLSSQSGFSPTEGITSSNLEIQFRQMVQNHRDVLQEAGLDFSDIVSGNVYLTDLNDYAAMNDLYREFFSANPGSRTTVKNCSGYERNNVILRSSFIASPKKESKKN